MSTHAQEHTQLLHVLQGRFAQHPQRHAGVAWPDVLARLNAKPDALATLARMEATGGEPDVIGQPEASGHIIFCDCAQESPSGRRSLCYDQDARIARKDNQPAGSAIDMAAAIGIALLTEGQYRQLQDCGAFDNKTSSWIATPPEVRKLGGALFCDRRYGRVFTYHNGVQSYYAARGFRGALRL